MPKPPAVALSLLEKMEISPFIAYRGAPPKWASNCDRTLPFYTWWEICAGHAHVTTATGTWHVGKGNWILIPHGMARHQFIEKNSRLTSLSFRAVWPNGKPILEMPHPIIGSARMKLTQMARLACAPIEKSRHSWNRPLMELPISIPEWIQFRSAFISFLGDLITYAQQKEARLTTPLSGDSRLDVILDSIRQELQAGNLPYAQWRSLLGLGRAQIDRLAKQHLGTTIKSQRDRLLQDEIRHQLALGTLSAKELAAKYHFADAAHFSKWVRKMTGQPPRQLRLAHA